MFVQRLLDGTRHNTMSGLAFAAGAEQGGSVLGFVAASLPDGAKFTCYVEGAVKQPYCVAIRPGAAPDEFIIEGYGKNIDKPFLTETATVGAPRRGSPGGNR